MNTKFFWIVLLRSVACFGRGKLPFSPIGVRLYGILCCAISAASAFDHVWSSGTVLGQSDTKQIAVHESVAPNSVGGSARIYAIRGDWDIYLATGNLSEQMLATLRGKARVLFCVEGEHLFILGPDQKDHDTHLLKRISRNAVNQDQPAGSEAVAQSNPPKSPEPAQPPQQQVGSVQRLTVKIINRQDREDSYDYAAVYSSVAVGGSMASGNSVAVGKTFRVHGATLTLQLPDGRLAVVNCDSKFAEHFAGPIGNRRSCRTPLVDEVEADFRGDNAKLSWSVSLDGTKVQSETYKILGVLSSSGR